MLKRILSFIGWGIAGFFVMGALALATRGQFSNTLWIMLWTLIFVPPIYKLTGRFGKIWNIVGRLIVLNFDACSFSIMQFLKFILTSKKLVTK